MEQSPGLWRAKDYPHLRYYKAFELTDAGREQVRHYVAKVEATEERVLRASIEQSCNKEI